MVLVLRFLPLSTSHLPNKYYSLPFSLGLVSSTSHFPTQRQMVTGGRQQQQKHGEKSRVPAGRSSWGPPALSGAQSASTSGSAGGGSPSIRSGPAIAAASTPARGSTFVRINQLDINADDDAGSSLGAASAKKKKRGPRAVGGDKNGRGLRQFSMKVCEKVESKGRTTYNEVADELVAEFADPGSTLGSADQQQYDEKNIRRRVYDALNVLMAMDIISKDKKEIQWKGLPRTSLNDIEELKAERVAVKSRIDKKVAYLQELEDQYIGLQNLVHRNEQLYGSGNVPSGGVALPFILVQTRPHATVEVEISEDMQLVHFDFNSTPFKLHDDSYVLKAMRFGERKQNEVAHERSSNGGESSITQGLYPPQMLQPTRPNSFDKLPTSPPVPGILKARVKHEH
ncbi:transcription factor-like protein DPB [Iris pallida]|uniref:Transcription factor-like protein DPB n=1 Tax=Iris pallida TaxID=29817 RepID=A0AAX6IEP8_IRIPA|nr:transcription factor-like protein DPB [Iris pallida]